MHKIGFWLLIGLCLSPWFNAPLALLMGLAFTLLAKHPYQKYSKPAINWLLKSAVVGLGFGISASQALSVGREGFILTIFSIALTMLAGWLIGSILDINKKSGYLLSSGTAICGGSAIAAIAPIIKASGKDISMAMGTVFLLNAVALLVFPAFGRWLQMSQVEFGTWSAIAIHDTSSVVGAASAYGAEALKIATTVKLARALWIIPLALITSLVFKNEGKIKIPWFIGLFILAMLANTYLPFPGEISHWIVLIARKVMTVVLFLVGASLSLAQIKEAGWRSMVLGVSLWLLISVGSLLAILYF